MKLFDLDEYDNWLDFTRNLLPVVLGILSAAALILILLFATKSVIYKKIAK